MKHLYFMRHGLSEANKAGVWSGSLLDAKLAPEGHEQAKKAAAQAKLHGLSFDTIVSSPQTRAHHTALYVCEATDYAPESIIIDDRFVERCFGILEGTAGYPELYAAYSKDESHIDSIEKVERLVDMQWRAQQALDYLHTLSAETVLVVAHGAFGRALRRAVNKEPLTIPIQAIPNAEIIKFI